MLTPRRYRLWPHSKRIMLCYTSELYGLCKLRLPPFAGSQSARFDSDTWESDQKMIIKPKVRGFLCTTTHPTGCDANVAHQIAYVKSHGPIANGPRRVLVIGASTGYGLASRITAAFGAGAATLGIFFEKEGTERKPGTAGWYNSGAFHRHAQAEGLYAKSINGDAFSKEIKDKAIATIKADMGQVDLVVYSLASPRRQHPVTGVVHNSTLKPIGSDAVQKGVNTDKEQIQDFHIEAATQEEIDNTVAVMGGEDWQMWIEALDEAGVLAEGAKTTAYTYIGEKITWDIYWHGTIGAAKKDLDKRVVDIRARLAGHGGGRHPARWCRAPIPPGLLGPGSHDDECTANLRALR